MLIFTMQVMGHFRQTGSMLQLLMPWHLVSPSHQQLCYYTPELLGGILVSLCPCVRPSRILCALCSTYSPAWIQFIFIHFIKQLQNVCCVQSFLQNLNFWQFLKICNFVLFWLGIWCESLVWVIMGRWGVSQNAGVLVVLVDSGHITLQGWF